MFSTKQSDVFYNDQTKELFVCQVSSISANRCQGDLEEAVFGALPIIYKIDKQTNYKVRVYPENFDTFLTDPNSDLYALTTKCSSNSATKFDSITKPLINFNKNTSRYSVTFLGKYETQAEGLAVNNYIFQDVNEKFFLLDSNTLVPEDKDDRDFIIDANKYTFEGGFLNSDFYTGGNTIRNKYESHFNPVVGTEIERSTNYMIGPTYVESTSSLGFNLILDNTVTPSVAALTGNQHYPFMYSGSYISYNPKYVAFDPKQTIRVDFRARCFNTAAMTSYGSAQSVIAATSASRWAQQFAPVAAGEGFCVFFYKQPAKHSYIIPNGAGHTLGYVPADAQFIEVAGSAQKSEGLKRHTSWSPISGLAEGGSLKDGDIGHSFLGVGFDVKGNFATTDGGDMPGSFNGTTYSTTPCSVSVRGNSFSNTKVLSSIALANVDGADSIPLHCPSTEDGIFVDYRIDLTNRGNKLTVYHKLTGSTDYNTILELRLNKLLGTYDDGDSSTSGSQEQYNPWEGLLNDDGTVPLLNVGLSYTTSDHVSQFELQSFKVTGVEMRDPWDLKKQKPDETTTSKLSVIDYINKSGENLRKRALNANTKEDVDIEMVVPAKGRIAQDLQESDNLSLITLCDDNNRSAFEDEVEIVYNNVNPERIDDFIRKTESGNKDADFDPNTIKRTNTSKEIDITATDTVYPVEEDVWNAGVFCKYRNTIANSIYNGERGPGQNQMEYVWWRFSAGTGNQKIFVKGHRVFANHLVFTPGEDDMNDWFSAHPERSKEDLMRAQAIRTALITAFKNAANVTRDKKNWVLAFNPDDYYYRSGPGPAESSSLLYVRPGSVNLQTGVDTREEEHLITSKERFNKENNYDLKNIIDNFLKIGFIELDEAVLQVGKVTPNTESTWGTQDQAGYTGLDISCAVVPNTEGGSPGDVLDADSSFIKDSGPTTTFSDPYEFSPSTELLEQIRE